MKKKNDQSLCDQWYLSYITDDLEAYSHIISDDIIHLCGGYEGLIDILKKRKVEIVFQIAFMYQVPINIIFTKMLNIVKEKNRQKVKVRILGKKENIIYADFSK